MATQKGIVGSGNKIFVDIGLIPQAFCRNDPTTGLILPPLDESITVATAAAIGDTTIDITGSELTALASNGVGLGAGTPIVFSETDATNIQYVIVAEDAAPGAASITVEPLQKAIAVGDTATVPGLARILGGEDTSESNETESTQIVVFEDENAFQNPRVTSQMTSISWSGLLLEQDQAYLRLVYFQSRQVAQGTPFLYLSAENPRPLVLGGASAGTKKTGLVIVENLNITKTTSEFLKIDFSAKFIGQPEESLWRHA